MPRIICRFGLYAPIANTLHRSSWSTNDVYGSRKTRRKENRIVAMVFQLLNQEPIKEQETERVKIRMKKNNEKPPIDLVP